MTPHLPAHIVARLRRSAPTNGHVVAGSTPVVSFGDASKADVATIGLNPSRQEFLDRFGCELGAEARRFETTASLNVTDLATAPEPVLHRVVDACKRYFTVNPYRQWFNKLDALVESVGASYYDGSACHLDLVQWATDPVWGKIPDRTVRDRLLRDDSPFLRQQLTTRSFRVLLINGNGVIREFESVMGIKLREVPGVSGVSARSRLFVGQLASGTRVVGWSTNVQSSFGVCKALRANLASRVGELQHGDAVA
jgi:hypothetical protein